MQRSGAYPSAACAPLMGSAGPLIRVRATSECCSAPTQRSLLSSLSVMYCMRLRRAVMGSAQHGMPFGWWCKSQGTVILKGKASFQTLRH